MESIETLLEDFSKAALAFDRVAVDSLAAKLSSFIGTNLARRPPAFILALTESVTTFDQKTTQALCAELIGHVRGEQSTWSLDDARQVLNLLRRKRHFELVIRIADALIQSGCRHSSLRRLYAQALIDAGHLSAAIDVLKRLEADCIEDEDDAELSEARGLLGRSYKQIYCDASTPGNAAGSSANRAVRSALWEAEQYYASEFRRDPTLIWHGINSVALRHRAMQDGLKPDNASGEATSVDSIVRHIAETRGLRHPGDIDVTHDAPDPWTCATLAEASIAQSDMKTALGWLTHYVKRPKNSGAGADAFEIASTLRQFEEVWRLSDTEEDHLEVLEVLRAALLEREGGSVSVVNARSEADAIERIIEKGDFEQILGKERFKNLMWYQTGLKRAQLVCRFVDRFGDGFGTGFAMRAADIGIPHSKEWVVVTNAHVVSEDAEEQAGNPAAVTPEAASVQFEASAHPGKHYAIEEVLVSSSRQRLDFSVLALCDDVDLSDAYPIADKLPLLQKDQRIYVIGHPRGSQLSFSLNDNLLLDYEAQRIHYRSPTEGGSSGSPLFNQAWELIGVHHAGSLTMKRLNNVPGNYPANEGLWVQSIRAAIAEKYGQPSMSATT